MYIGEAGYDWFMLSKALFFGTTVWRPNHQV